MVAETVEESGKLDVLINNAANYSCNNADVPDMDLDNWYDALTVSVSGTGLCRREAMKVMIPRKSGVLANVSSVAGISGHPTESPTASPSGASSASASCWPLKLANTTSG